MLCTVNNLGHNTFKLWHVIAFFKKLIDCGWKAAPKMKLGIRTCWLYSTRTKRTALLSSNIGDHAGVCNESNFARGSDASLWDVNCLLPLD